MSDVSAGPTFDAQVVVLDDDADMVESLRDLLRLACHLECLTATSYDAFVALGPRALACRVAILDINLGPGQPSGIQAYKWLRQGNFRGRVAFLTGHAYGHPLVSAARDLGHIEIIEKPAPVETLLRLIEE